jgi:hypothetical protein
MFGIRNLREPRELSQPNQLDMVGERGFEPPALGPERDRRQTWNHPRQSPTIHLCCPYFPVFSSPTATLEGLETRSEIEAFRDNMQPSVSDGRVTTCAGLR